MADDIPDDPPDDYTIVVHPIRVPAALDANTATTTLRCMYCQREAKVPTEHIPLTDLRSWRDDDGVRLAACPTCVKARATP
jgi:hypothetical protein